MLIKKVNAFTTLYYFKVKCWTKFINSSPKKLCKLFGACFWVEWRQLCRYLFSVLPLLVNVNIIIVSNYLYFYCLFNRLFTIIVFLIIKKKSVNLLFYFRQWNSFRENTPRMLFYRFKLNISAISKIVLKFHHFRVQYKHRIEWWINMRNNC